ncbi:MAG: hypothetical protein AAGN35_24120 [Bacteroidota bacterium]
MTPKLTILCTALLLFFGSPRAQTWLDLSVATSAADRIQNSLALRHQFSKRFRAGLELQASHPRYRFIEARPIREGYSFAFSLPLRLTIQESKRMRLDLFGRLGGRIQGIIDPDENDQRDSILNSAAVLVEPGLLITIKASDRLHFLTGITFPILYEVSPGRLLENQTNAIRAGASYRLGDRSVLFAQALTGPATGASGDSHKYHWGLHAGVRFRLAGERSATELSIAPSF